ncbi:MAG TPA: radical SAM protein [Chthoniobacterales bacterium]|nr:radical SAM protein [Chthoniobacterales bacterium]
MSTTIKNAVVRDSALRFRYDVFGGLCWFPHGEIFHLTSNETAILDLAKDPLDLACVGNLMTSREAVHASRNLLERGLIRKTKASTPRRRSIDSKRVSKEIEDSRAQPINKPFWSHIQPFRFCNQRCIHCYCDGGNHQEGFELPITTWRSIVDTICDFGVLEIYITGGENLIVEDCYALTKYIIDKGLGTGLSTNAMHVTGEVLERLKDFELEFIQVSLDAASPELNDAIRGKHGAWKRTIAGIQLLKTVMKPVINCVVSKHNIQEVRELVLLGVSLGVRHFKVFPQKSVGRAISQQQVLLDRGEILRLGYQCQELAAENHVSIDYLRASENCGSGFSGFAVDQSGDMFPCIFGIADESQRVGSLLTEDLADLWFAAPRLAKFREEPCAQPCRRCELTRHG